VPPVAAVDSAAPKYNGVRFMTNSMTKSLIVTGLLLLAPVAFAQNTITPGQSQQDRGAGGPQPPAALSASGGVSGGVPDCGPVVGTAAAPPCGTTDAPNRDVGVSGPVVPTNQPNATSSSSILDEELKRIETAAKPAPALQPR
jgi:hypothetical protein